MVLLGDKMPNFSANTTQGEITFYDWLDNHWCILFSHPADFTPVCTTELAEVVNLMPEFNKRNIKVIALSCDSVETHKEWINDIKAYAKNNKNDFPYPIIEDPERKLAIKLNIIDPKELDKTGIPLTARAVFIIDKNATMRLSILYPATTGRNFNEILRVIDSLLLTESYPVATPVNWKPGDEIMILPTLDENEATAKFSKINSFILPSGKNYLRKCSINNIVNK